MLKINLSPGPPRRRLFEGWLPRVHLSLPAGDRALTGGIVGLAALVIVGVVLYFVKAHEISRINDRLEVAVADSTRYAESIALIDQIHEREDWVRQRIDVIQQVDQHRYLWARLMAGVNDALPRTTWLTSIETLTPFPALSFRIDGVSFSNIDVANLMRNLARIPDMHEVVLISTREREIDGASMTAFSLECHYGQGSANAALPDAGEGPGRPAGRRSSGASPAGKG